MKIKVLKNKLNKGITSIDVVISVIIVTLFASIIATLFYNLYITTTARKRNAIATNCLIDVIENVKMMEYSDVDDSGVSKVVQDLINDNTIPQGYNVTSSITKYNETEGNTDKKDLVKILKVSVNYKLGSKEEKIEISTLITK
jgi:Tfp pilus assembly protein PilE